MVEPKQFLEFETLVADMNDLLLLDTKAEKLELVLKATFVDRFNQTRPKMPMNLNGRTDYGVAEFIGSLELGMHLRIFVSFVTFCRSEEAPAYANCRRKRASFW